MSHPFTIPYFTRIAQLLSTLEQTQSENIEKAALACADALQNNGVIHTFGCGHSASVALEPFHRSGCFVPVDAVLDPGLMFQLGAHAGTALERLEGYSPVILARHDFKPKDVLIIVSNSGRNAAGIDAAFYAKERAVTAIAITAAGAHAHSVSRHSSGKLLKDAADIVLDNGSPKEEASLTLNGVELAPISTIGGCAVLHAMLYRTAEILLERGVELPVYKSSNAASNDGSNEALAARYATRVKHIQ